VWSSFECCLPENFVDRDIVSHDKSCGIKFTRYIVNKVWKVLQDGPFFGRILLWGEESRISNHSIKVREAVHIRKRPYCNQNVTVSLDHPKSCFRVSVIWSMEQVTFMERRPVSRARGALRTRR
jgi:hypothetical protein